jgi:hypothetical protein
MVISNKLKNNRPAPVVFIFRIIKVYILFHDHLDNSCRRFSLFCHIVTMIELVDPHSRQRKCVPEDKTNSRRATKAITLRTPGINSALA